MFDLGGNSYRCELNVQGGYPPYSITAYKIVEDRYTRDGLIPGSVTFIGGTSVAAAGDFSFTINGVSDDLAENDANRESIVVYAVDHGGNTALGTYASFPSPTVA